MTKRELLADVWHQSYGGGDRTVDVHLSWLRRKLGETAADPRYLHSVRGVGVRLAAPGNASGKESGKGSGKESGKELGKGSGTVSGGH